MSRLRQIKEHIEALRFQLEQEIPGSLAYTKLLSKKINFHQEKEELYREMHYSEYDSSDRESNIKEQLLAGFALDNRCSVELAETINSMEVKVRVSR